MRLSRTITAPTASRGHVERVATSCEIRVKYSSHDGRTFFKASWSRVVSTPGSLKGSIEPVARVPEARHYERALVQLRVDGGGVEVHVGVLARHALDARHGGDGVEAGDPGRPLLLELVYGRGQAAAGREHRVENENEVLAEVPGQVHVVLDGEGGLLVALQAHESHGGPGEQGEGPVEHPEAGA